MKRLAWLFIAFFLLLPALASAELSDDMKKDFSVIDGYIIMHINGEYLVDLDDRNQLNIGDILTVVKKGKTVLHPVSKEVVGSLDIPVGFLKVTRIHSGYSYATPLDATQTFADGMRVKRFEQVPARFVDKTNGASDLKQQVETNLPHFAWQEASAKDEALLVFTLNEENLNVSNVEGISLHKYLINDDQQLVSAAAITQRPFVTAQKEPKPKLLQQVANSIVGVFEESNDERFAEMDEAIIRNKQIERQGIWLSPNLTGEPVGLAVADTDGDGQQEVVTILDNTVTISRVVDGQYVEIGEAELSANLQPLCVDAIDLNNDGRAEIYLSAMAEYTPSALVIEYDGAGYSIVEKNIRWFLRVVNLPGQQGRTLVGQRIGNEKDPYAGDLFTVKREGENLVKGDSVPLPDQLGLFNFIPVTDDRNQLNFAYLTNGDYLKVISSSGDELYESSDYFGGSEISFNTRKEYRDEGLEPIYMRPRMVRMPGNEILVAQNDGQRMVQRYREFNKSRVVALGWNGFAMNEIWRTASQSGYLADFTLADADNDGQDEIVMAVKFQSAGMFDEARSAIVMYELD